MNHSLNSYFSILAFEGFDVLRDGLNCKNNEYILLYDLNCVNST